MPAPFDVRVALPGDAAIIAWHRARMFQDIGEESVVAGAGVQLRRAFPHMVTLPDGPAVAHGRHAIVLNVFTEPEWRRRGLAELLIRQVIAWAREEQLDRLVLHASPQGRALYERLGFQGTNEMRFKGILRGFIEEP